MGSDDGEGAEPGLPLAHTGSGGEVGTSATHADEGETNSGSEEALGPQTVGLNPQWIRTEPGQPLIRFPENPQGSSEGCNAAGFPWSASYGATTPVVRSGKNPMREGFWL